MCVETRDSIFAGKQVQAADLISQVGQGSRRDSPTTRLGESRRVSLGDGGNPRHRRVSPI